MSRSQELRRRQSRRLAAFVAVISLLLLGGVALGSLL